MPSYLSRGQEWRLAARISHAAGVRPSSRPAWSPRPRPAHCPRLSGALKRRLEALVVARTMNPAEVDAGGVEAFEPEELQHGN
jgi:hypothetical protein